MKLWGELRNRLTFIVGSAKNAGKTTFMNLAARSLRPSGPVAMLTIGVDGEGRDQVFGTAKPLVPVEENDWIVTTHAALRASTGLFRVAQVYPISTVLGQLVLAQAKRHDFVELVGPETNSQLEAILADLLSEQKISTILVDGAVNRVTQVSARAGAGVVDVLKVTPSTLQSAEEHVRLMSQLFSLPTVAQGLARQGKRSSERSETKLPANWFEFDGALTSSKLEKLPRSTKALVVRNFSSIFLNSTALTNLPCPLFVRERFPLRALIVNGFEVDEADFAKRVSNLTIAKKILFNPHKESLP